MSVFHYTDANGLIGILENHCLWVNDANYMNDTHELKEGLIKFRDKLTDVGGDKALTTAKFVDILIQNPYQIGKFFITSFCSDGNILDMWRGYGSSGQKYAIEFDQELLIESLKQQYPTAKVELVSCIYEANEIEAFIAAQVERWLNDEQAARVEPRGEGVALNINVKKLMEIIVSPALAIKNYGFASERETRIIVSLPSDFIEVSHRGGAYGITPFIPFTFDNQAIKSITIGPTDSFSRENNSVGSILKKIGFEVPFPENFIQVSDITFRS
ncbi:DUF2971 domain-containing protein [Vibrio cholerae]|uniref:DUF2971 domain-containing protein n=1 Tax=Vibrio cholerae TaxID=666 RepID=UPI0011EE813D|nr:DUF2971 domain-containing protein [Vibrio cholerae]EGR4436974.1 DUF2971 domain-containing protein [Vibrio cholerae]TYW35279.1 DUF2971 domain-containing protein [Vibrio cholerae]